MTDEAKWNDRFSGDRYAYGKKENDFLRNYSHLLPKGKVLSLAEGEGRNALFLAKLGYDVTAVDYSEVGLEKTEERAKDANVHIHTIQADLTNYDFGNEYWQGIVSIYFHIHKDSRSIIHQKCADALAPKGVFILESFSTDQLKFGTGGPKNSDLLFNLEEVMDELVGLDFKIARTIEREIIEGDYHTGLGSVIQIVAEKK